MTDVAVNNELPGDFRKALAGIVGGQHVLEADAAAGWINYGAWVPAARPISDYTARIIPHNEEVEIPLEYDKIIWQH